jgi:hypothetical protein
LKRAENRREYDDAVSPGPEFHWTSRWEHSVEKMF